ncbi:LacI family DNA-binding transcriptional regulator [Gryllotalpicola reticulitermitis]|uniref:LacI family DNA-binding transcriptional regulator n=1 Tax=Gryllotalpicola reticulitermitis TaxID=1184153 RepID=A0ABV8Q9B7_9MICO
MTPSPADGRRAVTIYQVAALAGVSASTVSRVFNGVKVSPELVPLVKAAADELDFRPNRAARALRTQTSDVIGLIVADIENPFFTALARGVEDEAQASGFSVMLGNSDEEATKERAYLDVALSQHLAGVIISPARSQSDVRLLLEQRQPVVAVDRSLDDSDVDSVVVDNEGGARAAAELLLADGYQRIGCIIGPDTTQTAHDRGAGWLAALSAAGMKLDPADYLVHGSAKLDGGKAAFEQLMALEEPPDAIFVGHNLMAIGVLEALAEMGRTPADFGISVFGDLPFVGLVPHGIHLITLPARELGTAAARVLLDRINGDTQPPRRIVIGAPWHPTVIGDAIGAVTPGSA